MYMYMYLRRYLHEFVLFCSDQFLQLHVVVPVKHTCSTVIPHSQVVTQSALPVHTHAHMCEDYNAIEWLLICVAEQTESDYFR